jgi:uncharacterized membrane protein YqjE
MVHQALRNGSPAPKERQNNGVIEGMSSFGTDLATLASLQARLAVCDLKDSARASAPIVAGLIIFGAIAAASVVLGLAGLSWWLAAVLQVQVGIVMMITGLVALIIASVAAALLSRRLGKCFSYFRRSQEELDRNLAWIRTTLVHSGR